MTSLASVLHKIHFLSSQGWGRMKCFTLSPSSFSGGSRPNPAWALHAQKHLVPVSNRCPCAQRVLHSLTSLWEASMEEGRRIFGFNELNKSQMCISEPSDGATILKSILVTHFESEEWSFSFQLISLLQNQELLRNCRAQGTTILPRFVLHLGMSFHRKDLPTLSP